MVDTSVIVKITYTKKSARDKLPNETAIELSQKLLQVIYHPNEDIETVKALIVAGANISIQDKNKCTPLHIAATFGHAGIAQVLLDNGADMYAKADKDMTAFLIAAAYGHIGMVTLFLGLDKKFIYDKDISGYTALHLAALYGRDRLIGILLEYGIDVEVRTPKDETALYLAVYNDSYNTTKALLNHGASMDVAYENNYPLHYAALKNNTQAMLALLENENGQRHINDFNTENDSVTPLHIAAYNQNVEALALLLQYGANIRDRSNSKFYQTDYTPLSLAIMSRPGYSLMFTSDLPQKTDAGYIVYTLQGQLKKVRPDIIYLDLDHDKYAVVPDNSTLYTGNLSEEHIILSTLSPELREESLKSPLLLQEMLSIILKNKPSLNRRALAVELLLNAGADEIEASLMFANKVTNTDAIKILNDEKNFFIKHIKRSIIDGLKIVYKDYTHIEIIKILMDNYKISEKKGRNKIIYEINISYASPLESLSAYLLFKKGPMGIKILFKEKSVIFNVEKEKIDVLPKVLSLFDPKNHILMATSHTKLASALGIEEGKKSSYEWVGTDSVKENYVKIRYFFSGYAGIKPFMGLLKKANLLYSGNGNLITVLYPYNAFLDETHCRAIIEKIKQPLTDSKEKESREKQKSVAVNDITLELQEKSRNQETFLRKEELELRQRKLALERAKGEKKYRANDARQDTQVHHTEQNTEKRRPPVKKNSNNLIIIQNQTFHNTTKETVHADAAVTTVAEKPCEPKEFRPFTRKMAPDMHFFIEDRPIETLPFKGKIKKTKSPTCSEKPKKEKDSRLKHLLLQYEDKDERLYNGKFIIRAIYHEIIQEMTLVLIRKDIEESKRNLLSQLRIRLVHYFCMDIHWDGIEDASLSQPIKKQSALFELAKTLCNKEDMSEIANTIIEKIPQPTGEVGICLELMNAELACLKAAFEPFKDNHYRFNCPDKFCQVFSCITSVCIIVECFNRLSGLFPHISTVSSEMPIDLLMQCRIKIRNPAMHEYEKGTIEGSTAQEMLDSYLRTAEIHTLILKLVNFSKFSLKQHSSLSTAMNHFPSPPKSQLRSGVSGKRKENLGNADRTYTSEQLSKTTKMSP